MMQIMLSLPVGASSYVVVGYVSQCSVTLCIRIDKCVKILLRQCVELISISLLLAFSAFLFYGKSIQYRIPKEEGYISHQVT